MTEAPDLKNEATEPTKKTEKTTGLSRASDPLLVAPAYGRLEDENESRNKQAA